jgi:hypothetical protein
MSNLIKKSVGKKKIIMSDEVRRRIGKVSETYEIGRSSVQCL